MCLQKLRRHGQQIIKNYPSTKSVTAKPIRDHHVHYIHDTTVLHFRLLEHQASRSAVARHGLFCRSVANALNS